LWNSGKVILNNNQSHEYLFIIIKSHCKAIIKTNETKFRL
jgi:hypothetical protein